jgi:hypothetical protein
MSTQITQALARQYVQDLIANAEQARLRRDLRRERRRSRNARRQALGFRRESGTPTSEPLTGARWSGFRPAAAR